MHYLELLRRLHDELQPAGYLEIGVDCGDSLGLSQARSVAIDPAPKPRPESLLGKPGLLLYVGTSDDFFREHERETVLRDAPLDLAFIDGPYEFAQVVRDLENIERWGHTDTVVAIHDVLPRNAWEAAPAFQEGSWTGDVWRIVSFLRRHRQDLRVWLTAAEPTGMLVVTGLDPAQSGMAELAAAEDQSFPQVGPGYDQLVDAFIASAAVAPAEQVLRCLSLPRRLEQEWEYDTKWGMRVVADTSWRPLLEAAAELPHTVGHDLGMRACLRLIGAFWLPEEVREQAWKHLAAYARPFAALWPGAMCRSVTPPGLAASASLAPSPVAGGDTLLTTLKSTPADGGQEPTWYLLTIDDDLAVVKASLLRGELGAPDRAIVSSIERLLPYADGEVLRACVTLSGRSPHSVTRSGLIEIAHGAIHGFRLLSDAMTKRPVRNWAPFSADAGSRFVAWWQPIEVLGVEPDTDSARRIAVQPAPRLAERFASASAGIPVPGGWLFLINEQANVDESEPARLARFVFLRDDFRVTAVSPHFWVTARGADEASGLTRQGQYVIAGFTSREQQALLARFPLDGVLASLMAIDSPGLEHRSG
jgi:hypothetical protein